VAGTGTGFRIRYCPFPCGLWQDAQLRDTVAPALPSNGPLPHATVGALKPLEAGMLRWAEVTSWAVARTDTLGRKMRVDPTGAARR
jgi:hypothetical protein